MPSLSATGLPKRIIRLPPGILRLGCVLFSDETMEERAAIRRLWEARVADDRRRFARWYAAGHRRLTLYCMGKLRDRGLAENAATDTLLKLLDQREPGAIRDVESWVFTVARNQCLTHLNKERNRREIRDRLAPGWAREADPEAEGNLACRDLRRLVRETLSARDLAIWDLHLQGYRNQEIAGRLKMPEKTVANRKTEARRRLREALADRRPGPRR